MAFTSSLGTSSSGLGNIELGIAAATTSLANAFLFIAIVQNRFSVMKVVQRSTNQLDTVPSQIDIGAAEIFPYIVDVTNYLGTNDLVTIISPSLTHSSTGNAVSGAWYNFPILQGNIITIPINCPYLRYGQKYQIAVNFTASSNKKATYISTFSVAA